MRSKVKTEDTELSGCVRTLESILHPEELEKYSHMLGSATDRAERWKARNGSTYS